MAVPEQTPINVYTATGLTTIFPFAFLVLSAEDLVVTVAGVEKVSGVDYTVAGVGVQAGGTVTMTTAPTAGQQVQVFRRSKLKRDRDYQTSGDLLADSLDDDIDRLVLVLQELHAGLFGPLPAPNDASTLRGQLANPASATEGAGMVGFDSGLTYPAGTVGAALAGGGGGGGLPTQTGNAGKLLLTDGSAASWVDLNDTFATTNRLGAVRRSTNSRLNDVVNVMDFIPEAEHTAIRNGTSTYDCRAAIQAAIDSMGLRGGDLFLPRGTYELSQAGANDWCLKLVAPTVMRGEGYFTVLKAKASVASSCHTIAFVPSPLVDCSQSRICDMFIGDPNTGTRNGYYGIFLDTRGSGSYLPELTISDIFVGESGQCAIAHLHDPNRAPAPGDGVNGGLYSATIEGCQLRGGIRLDSSGDSIRILGNIISGEQIGIYASIIAGASQLHIIGNNITSTQGAIKLDRASRPHIIGNNIEQVVVGNNNSSSMINLAGGNGAIIQPLIAGNNMGAFSGTGINQCIRVNSSEGGLIQDNSFLPSSATQYGITLNAGAQHMRVGWNQYGSGSTRRVQDSGTGTMGVARSFEALLQNGWVKEGGNFGDCWYFKDHLGFVEIHGVIKSGSIGTLSSSVTLFTLPEDYRPAKSEHFVCYSQDTSPAVVPGAILVNATNGLVLMVQGSNGIFTFNCRFMAAKPALADVRWVSVGSTGYGPGHVSDN